LYGPNRYLDTVSPELVIPGPLGLNGIRLGLGLLATASKADDAACDRGEDEDDEGHPKRGPRAGASVDIAHLVLDADKEGNVNGKDDEGEERSEEGDEGSDEEDGEVL